MRRGMVLCGLALLLMASAGLSLAAIGTSTSTVTGVTVTRAQLLTDAAATTDGEWIDATGMRAASIHIAGITSATVEINGSNATTRPDNSTHGIKLNATDITSDQIAYVTLNVRWLKVRIPTYVSGTINVYLEGRN